MALSEPWAWLGIRSQAVAANSQVATSHGVLQFVVGAYGSSPSDQNILCLLPMHGRLQTDAVCSSHQEQ